MLRRLLTSRWRHLLTLIPLGAIVGLLFGLAFNDLSYGLLVGLGFGGAFGLMFSLRNPR